jgi:hypothetical protein
MAQSAEFCGAFLRVLRKSDDLEKRDGKCISLKIYTSI